jgi:hypothetical protein
MAKLKQIDRFCKECGADITLLASNHMRKYCKICAYKRNKIATARCGREYRRMLKNCERRGLVVTTWQLRRLADNLDDEVRELDMKVAKVLRTRTELDRIRHLVPIINVLGLSDTWKLEKLGQMSQKKKRQRK